MSTTSKTIQEKTEELSELVAWFNSDSFSLESAIEKFKQAEKLAAEIEKDLLSLKNEIQVIKQNFEGSA
jgi:exodeoxyribonuclease VII small subunit